MRLAYPPPMIGHLTSQRFSKDGFVTCLLDQPAGTMSSPCGCICVVIYIRHDEVLWWICS